MKWTMGLLLLAATGCGYRQTRMVACPETGCGNHYAARASPQGLPSPREQPAVYQPVQRTEYRPIYRAEPVASPPLPPPADVPPDEPLPPPAP